MAIPDFQSLMLPVLIQAMQGEMRIGDVVENLMSEFKLTDEERTHLLPSGRQTTFANRVHWAKTFLAKAGLIENTKRGHFKITDLGKKILSRSPDKITMRFLDDHPETQDAYRAFRSRELSPSKQVPFKEDLLTGPEPLTPDEVMRRAHQDAEDALASTLLSRVRAGTPAFFEKVVVNLLLAMGYGGSDSDAGAALVGKSGDGGIDGIIDQDPLGLDRIYVQAKRYKEGNNVGAGEIRDFFGSLDHFKATKGLFVTSSFFTSAAKETASGLSKRIVLIDGEAMARLMIRHEVGCRVTEVLKIKREDEDFFE